MRAKHEARIERCPETGTEVPSEHRLDSKITKYRMPADEDGGGVAGGEEDRGAGPGDEERDLAGEAGD